MNEKGSTFQTYLVIFSKSESLWSEIGVVCQASFHYTKMVGPVGTHTCNSIPELVNVDSLPKA